MVTATKAPVDTLDLIFKALASHHRREILRILSEADGDRDKTCCPAEEVCACKISDRLGLSASTMSHHMSVLKNAGLVAGRKDGLWIHYTVKRDALETAAQALHQL